MSGRQPWAVELAGLQLRPAGPDDRDRVRRFLAAMDREGLYQRHFMHGEVPNQALLGRIDALGGGDRAGVLALGREGEVLAHGEYVAEHAAAEFALMVLPQWRACGIGAALLRALLDIAAAAGLREMHGMIQAGNTGALRLVRNNGFRVVPGDDATVVIVSRELTPGREAVPDQPAARLPLPFIRHDPDRTPLHRRLGPGTPLRAGGG